MHPAAAVKFLVYQVVRISRMVVHFSPESHDAANLIGATIQTARKRFCTHSEVALRETNCDLQGPVFLTTESSLRRAALSVRAASRRRSRPCSQTGSSLKWRNSDVE